MTYNQKKYPRPLWKNKPSSPANRKEAWVTIMIRSTFYAMLRELAEFHNITIGQAAMFAIEKDFREVLENKQGPMENPPPPTRRGRPKSKVLYVPKF
jgi:hypothetical protein